MGTIRTAAEDLADQITAGGQVRGYVDPAKANTNRPCVLVTPPVLDYTNGSYAGPMVTWRLIALSSHPSGTLAALDELADLLVAIEAVVPVERAEPANYVLTPPTEPVPAYVVTTTTG